MAQKEKQNKNGNKKAESKKTHRHCEYVQQLRFLKIPLEEIENTIADYRTIKQWAYIIHDKDVYTKEDEAKNPANKAGTQKEPHIHLYLHFGQSSATLEDVARWFKDDVQWVSTIKRKKKDVLAYLTHKNSAEKYQYSMEDVHSNFDVEQEIQNEIENEEKTDIDTILRRIADGTIREYNRFEYIDDVVLAKNSNLIKNAFKNRSEKIMRDPNRNIKVIFIYGNTGSGKTTYAKMLAEKIGNGSYYVSSSANDSMQDYAGQETAILDDLRDNAFEFPDLLKMLDNYTATSIRSRFYNKTFLGSTIIITTTVPILDWYKFSKEDKAQLRRRISNYLIVDNKEICFYTFNPDNDYMPEFRYKIKNPVADLIAQRTKEIQKHDDILELCLEVLDGVDDNAKDDYINEINRLRN